MKTKPFQNYLEDRLSPEEISEIENDAIQDLEVLAFIEKGKSHEGSTFESLLKEYGIFQEVMQLADNKVEEEYKRKEKEFFLALIKFVKYKLGTLSQSADNELLNRLLVQYSVFKKIMVETQSNKN